MHVARNSYQAHHSVNVVAKPGVKVRVQIARALQAIIFQQQPLDAAINYYGDSLPAADRSLLQAVCYGVMRHYESLNWMLKQLSSRPVKKLDQLVVTLLLSGLHQLRDMRIPEHAAIHATVESTYPLKLAKAKGLVNAVLRNYQRQAEDLQASLAGETAAYDHPPWLLSQLKQDWPDDWQSIVAANNTQPPMALRVDCNQCSVEEYQQQLTGSGLSAQPHESASCALVLDQPADVAALPGFDRGLVSVQDAAAQLAVPMLQHDETHRVLDACAAPGGKTAQIWQVAQPRQLDALDVSQSRLDDVTATMKRIRAKARCICGDAAEPSTWWDGEQYDRILLDAPCSASGVIRRHPDIKYHRSPEAIAAIVERQRGILDALWPLLKPGGIMVYVTCSVFKSENERQIADFCQRQADVERLSINGGWGHGNVGRQLLPGENNMDGFYFAPLVKQAT